jgi:hypothetical protein
MNARQAKAEPLVEFLARMGYQPANVRGNDVWYTSPFRPSEKTPSFKIDRLKNLWYDHGAGQGGTIIDFVQELHPQADFSQILSTIGNTVGAVGQVYTGSGVIHRNPPSDQLTIATLPAILPVKALPIIESVASIDDRLLEAYLNSRAIPVDLARVYLKQIAYRVGGKSYRALAFPNDAGGFEVRNPHFKGTIGKKDLTYIPQAGVSASTHTAVFEGFFDFLSVLAHYGKDQAQANVLVLNSLSLLERAAEKLNTTATRKIYAYLDQDEAGRAGLATLRERGAWDIVDGSHLYQHHKDANEFLV